ncbi:PIN-like domain-containing protein [Enterococcus faecium]|uniref:PIN-like domain-containing protein n=1 Tax=Enterococcus faecium TaxID=1352 RepID=UPI0034E9684D
MSYLQAISYNFSPEDKDEVLYVIDSNYFLYAFQSYSNGESYISALENSKRNLYVPFIVYVEFLHNINNKIELLKKDIAMLERYVNSGGNHVELFDENSLKKKIKKDTFKLKANEFNGINILLKEDIENKIDKYVDNTVELLKVKYTEMNELIEKQIEDFLPSIQTVPNLLEYEKKVEFLTNSLNKLFEENDILGDEYIQENVSDYTRDMDNRYKNDIPPGFCDKDKLGEKNFGKLIIPNKSGDLILWRETIKILNEKEKYNNYKKIVIVTNDGLSKEKSDWRRDGNGERIVHDHLRIEFFQETQKFVDLISVQQFIDLFSSGDSEAKEMTRIEIDNFDKKERKVYGKEDILFTLFEKQYRVDHQFRMMQYIFQKIIDRNHLVYDDIKQLSCVKKSLVGTSSIFDSNRPLTFADGTNGYLATRLTIDDKMRHLSFLFEIAEEDSRKLFFENIKIRMLWNKQNNIKSLGKIDELNIVLDFSESRLGIAEINGITGFFLGEQVETNWMEEFEAQLINTELHEEDYESYEEQFRNIVSQNLGVDLRGCHIEFKESQ